MRGGQREEAHPRDEPVARADARVRDAAQHVAVHARDRAGQQPVARQRHAHVDGGGRDRLRQQPHGVLEDLLDVVADLRRRRRRRAGRAAGSRARARPPPPPRASRRRAARRAAGRRPATPRACRARPAARPRPRRCRRRRRSRAAGAGTRAPGGARTRRGRRARPPGLRSSGSGSRRNGAGSRRSSCVARAPPSVTRSKLHGASGEQLAGREVARVERLQRVPHEHLRARVAAHRALDRVEQLADRDRGRPRRVRPHVVAGVGDDEPVARRHQRVEQHLAVLEARVALADVRLREHQVVAVARRLARERAVVEAEQADDAVRDRAHRDERADRQVAGPEVRARRAALEAVGEQRADLRQRQLRAARLARLLDDGVEDPLQLRALPGVVRGGRGERVGGGGDRLRPGADRPAAAEAVDRRRAGGRRARPCRRRARSRCSRRRRSGARPRTAGGPPPSSSRRRAAGRARTPTCPRRGCRA